jgi:hypothetical protein
MNKFLIGYFGYPSNGSLSDWLEDYSKHAVCEKLPLDHQITRNVIGYSMRRQSM